jgi:hypothetical protein
MASTLLDINRAIISKARVLNPFSTAMKLLQDAEIGKAEKIEKRFECNN